MLPLAETVDSETINKKFHTTVILFLNSSSEIPQYRLPYDAVNFEVELMKDLGVKVTIFFFAFP